MWCRGFVDGRGRNREVVSWVHCDDRLIRDVIGRVHEAAEKAENAYDGKAKNNEDPREEELED